MILLAHPFGNANVRAVLTALEEAGLLAKFITTLGWSSESPLLRALPAKLKANLSRRSYELPNEKIETHAGREVVRLIAGVAQVRGIVTHEKGWASIDRVWQRLDAEAARWLCVNKMRERITAVYGYEDCALRLFENARVLGVRRVYDLPIAYYETSRRLLREEAQRYPDWEPTLGGTRDSNAKLARKQRELELAELVICPSNFVLESLPENVRATKQCVVIPFGSPSVPAMAARTSDTRRPLRVLFAGALTQRKGLADLFEAMKLVSSNEVELVVMGSLLQPLNWYRERCAQFIFEPPRPHADVLVLMATCDVFVLPSIVEGRALVQQEAMACGLPVIVTENAGADDLVSDGETGFVVPIRSPAKIAEKISWCATHRESVSGMGIASQRRAAELTWRGYGAGVLAAIRTLTGE